MKFAFFDNDRLGVVTDDKITDVTHIVKEHDHHTAQALLELAITKFDALRPRFEKELPRSKVPPFMTVMLEVLPSAASVLASRVPPLITVAPE